ncbi:transportin mos14 [Quercus suber]|uniref:Transportin mos14 n=1 Tax=Quercus suber TaxID=58331 RepID=A0AAW0M380_QUESU
MELQNTVKEALNALYHHPDDTVRMQADRWLQDFQRTLDAWQVADNLLHDATSNLETLIFCSQTLRSKVQRDFEELPSEAFRPLRDSLNVNITEKISQRPPKVRTQISIAVAALAVYVPAEDWGDGGIVNWLRDEMNSHPEYIPGFLELLTVLPEEVYNYKIAARPERRRQFEKELTSQMEVALSILTACLSINELKEQVLEAFASWLRLKHGESCLGFRIPGSVLASHPLVLTALSSLNSEPLSEASVNVISELIHYTAAGSSGGVAVQMPLIQVLVPQVMSLKALLKDSSKDEEDVKAIARLFADMGDSYVELIATGSDESMIIVNALLEVASHPENYIASMTFNFWHSLQVILTKRDTSLPFGNEASIEAERKRRQGAFVPSYESLVSLVSFRVEYPQDYLDLSHEDRREFKQTRYEALPSMFISSQITYVDSSFSPGSIKYEIFFDLLCGSCDLWFLVDKSTMTELITGARFLVTT